MLRGVLLFEHLQSVVGHKTKRVLHCTTATVLDSTQYTLTLVQQPAEPWEWLARTTRLRLQMIRMPRSMLHDGSIKSEYWATPACGTCSHNEGIKGEEDLFEGGY